MTCNDDAGDVYLHAGCLLANIGVSAILEPRQDFTVIENQAFEMAAAGTGISVMATRTGYGYWVQQAREAIEAERQSAAG